MEYIGTQPNTSHNIIKLDTLSKEERYYRLLEKFQQMRKLELEGDPMINGAEANKGKSYICEAASKQRHAGTTKTRRKVRDETPISSRKPRRSLDKGLGNGSRQHIASADVYGDVSCDRRVVNQPKCDHVDHCVKERNKGSNCCDRSSSKCSGGSDPRDPHDCFRKAQLDVVIQEMLKLAPDGQHSQEHSRKNGHKHDIHAKSTKSNKHTNTKEAITSQVINVVNYIYNLRHQPSRLSGGTSDKVDNLYELILQLAGDLQWHKSKIDELEAIIRRQNMDNEKLLILLSRAKHSNKNDLEKNRHHSHRSGFYEKENPTSKGFNNIDKRKNNTLR